MSLKVDYLSELDDFTKQELYGYQGQQNSGEQFIQQYEEGKKDKQLFKIEINPLLQPQLAVSEHLIAFSVRQAVEARMSQTQDKVYHSLTSSDAKNYLSHLYNNISLNNNYIVDQIQSLASISPVPNAAPGFKAKRKSDLKQLQAIDQYRLLKIRQGPIKQKMNELKQKLQDQYFRNKHNIRVNPNARELAPQYYSLQHPKTKQVHQYLDQLKKRRARQRSSFQNSIQYEHLRNFQLQEQKAKLVQFKIQQHRQQIQRIAMQKIAKRNKQKQEAFIKQQQYQQLLRMYQKQKPISFKLQQQYITEIVIPQQEQRLERLSKIKHQHAPMNHQQLDLHQRRYRDYKQDNNIRRQAQRQSVAQQQTYEREFINRHYYKGKFRYYALQDMIKAKQIPDLQQPRRIKQERLQAYSLHVKQNMIPKTIHIGNNHKSAQMKIRVRSQNKNGSNPYEQGIKNLSFVKSKVAQEVAAGRQKPPNIILIEQKMVYSPKIEQNSQLIRFKGQKQLLSIRNKQSKELRPIRYKQPLQILANSQQGSKKGKDGSDMIATMLTKAKNLDQDINWKQKKLRNNSVRTVDEHNQLQKLEEKYLKSIQMKMGLIQSLN